MKHIKLIFLSFVIMVFGLVFKTNYVIAQHINNVDKEQIGSKFFTGGNFGFQFGSITLIDISPLIGYKITEDFAVGTGLTYQYYYDKNYNFKINIYGGRIFARYYFLENLFAHTELEALRYYYNYNPNIWEDNKVNVTNILVGGGYRQYLGRHLYAIATILWNLNESPYSLYKNPIIRVGINVGL